MQTFKEWKAGNKKTHEQSLLARALTLLRTAPRVSPEQELALSIERLVTKRKWSELLAIEIELSGGVQVLDALKKRANSGADIARHRLDEIVGEETGGHAPKSLLAEYLRHVEAVRNENLRSQFVEANSHIVEGKELPTSDEYILIMRALLDRYEQLLGCASCELLPARTEKRILRAILLRDARKAEGSLEGISSPSRAA